jgi:hypothetical protein
MAALASEREKTLKARQEINNGFEKAMEVRKRKLDARREMIQNKRIQVLGKEEVERIDREWKEREAEVFLRGLEDELGGGGGAGKN